MLVESGGVADDLVFAVLGVVCDGEIGLEFSCDVAAVCYRFEGFDCGFYCAVLVAFPLHPECVL